MKKIGLYRDGVSERRKGIATVYGEECPAEIVISASAIELRFFDFKNKVSDDFSDLIKLDTAVFSSNGEYFRFVGMEFKESSVMFIGQMESFRDYTFAAKGVIHSRVNLNDVDRYQALSFYSNGINQWLGNTIKLNKIINGSVANQLPTQEDLLEFERDIKGVGILAGYYSYEYGGLEGIHTVGMSVMPHVNLHFEKVVDLNGLVEHYINLYMIMRFLHGKYLDFTNVRVYLAGMARQVEASLYFPEKRNSKRELYDVMPLPYSSPYQDGSESNFPLHIFDRYFDPENEEVNLLIKRFINYTLIDSDEEKFLGFYRVIERVTFKQSYFIDELVLSNLFDRSRKILQNKLQGVSISKFRRAVLKANKSKANTEACIRDYIKRLPSDFIANLGLGKIKVDEICKVRNDMTHQPFFSISAQKLFDCMNVAKILSAIILMVELGIPFEQIEQTANICGWTQALAY